MKGASTRRERKDDTRWLDMEVGSSGRGRGSDEEQRFEQRLDTQHFWGTDMCLSTVAGSQRRRTEWLVGGAH
jgi:hypothetical protein